MLTTDVTDFTHMGWIPCINGHMDFALIQPGIVGGFTNKSIQPEPPILINYSPASRPDHHFRRIVMQSHVDWQDNPDDECTGAMRVFTLTEVSESDDLDQRSLVGHVYMYLEPNISKWARLRGKLTGGFTPVLHTDTQLDQRPWTFLLREADQLQRDLKKERRDPSQQDRLRDLLDKKVSEINEALQRRSPEIYVVRFHVFPNGLTFLAHHGRSGLSGYAEYLLCRKAYYYIKYSLHRHTHHDDDTDSLTTIVPYYDSLEGKRCAALRLIGQLKRETTRIKRSPPKPWVLDATSPSGVLAYAGSLILALHDSRFLTPEDRDRELAFINQVRLSFDASAKRRELEERGRSEVIGKYRTFLTMTLSIAALATLLLLKSFIEVPDDAKIPSPIDLQTAGVFFVLGVAMLFLTKEALQRREIAIFLNDRKFKKWVELKFLVGRAKFWAKATVALVLAAMLYVGLPYLAF